MSRQSQHAIVIFRSDEKAVVSEQCGSRFHPVLIHGQELDPDPACLAAGSKGRCSEAVCPDGDLDEFTVVGALRAASEDGDVLILAFRRRESTDGATCSDATYRADVSTWGTALEVLLHGCR